MKEEDYEDKFEHVEIKKSMHELTMQMDTGFAKVEASLDIIAATTAQNLEQAKQTNGRVTQLEKDIDFIRFFRRNKFILLIAIFGAIKIIEAIDIDKIISKIITLF